MAPAIETVGATAAADSDVCIVYSCPGSQSADRDVILGAFGGLGSCGYYFNPILLQISACRQLSSEAFWFQPDAAKWWSIQNAISDDFGEGLTTSGWNWQPLIYVQASKKPCVCLDLGQVWVQDSDGAALTTSQLGQTGPVGVSGSDRVLPAYADTRPISELEAAELLGYLRDAESRPRHPVRRVREIDASSR